MESKKVLFVATVVKKHINVFHLPYLKWFQEQGYETHVAAKDDFNGAICDIPHCDKHYDITFERYPFNKNNIKAYRQLKKIINENNYKIIHCHTPVASILTRFAAIKARKKGTKIIYTAHGFHFFKGSPLINWLIYFPIEWICSFLTDILITINNEDYYFAQKYMRSNNIVHIKGVGVKSIRQPSNQLDSNIKEDLGIPQNSKILLSVGELSSRKNHQIVIKALSRISYKNVYYIICGEGEKRRELETLIEDLGLQKQVYLLGFRKDIFKICKYTDIFVFPSLQEGLPVAVMEAMMNKLPVVASDIRGNSDLILSGRGGYLFNYDDSLALKNCLEELLYDESLCQSMGAFNASIIEEYSIENIIQDMCLLYSSIVNN